MNKADCIATCKDAIKYYEQQIEISNILLVRRGGKRSKGEQKEIDFFHFSIVGFKKIIESIENIKDWDKIDAKRKGL